MWEFNSISSLWLIETMNFSVKSIYHLLSSLSSDPLFSSIVTLYVLIFLYFPSISVRIVFSPVPILTGVLLFSLLRFGEIQKVGNGENRKNRENREIDCYEAEEFDSRDENHKWVVSESEIESVAEIGFDLNSCFEESFVEWNVSAPLEVIYEAFEGEEYEQQSEMDPDPDPNQNQNPDEKEIQIPGIERRYEMLSLYYDSETSSEDELPAIGEWYSPEGLSFRWDEEDKEGLIEIALDGKSKRDNCDFSVEEENLIEIDISPARNGDFPMRN